MTFTTFIPTKRNDGSPISKTERDDILDGTWRRFGGYTLGAVQDGAWLDPKSGKVLFDKSRPLVVTCDRSQLNEAREWVLEIGRRLDQKAMSLKSGITMACRS